MSSTIGDSANGESQHEGRRTRQRAARAIGKQRQRELFALLMQGASPQVACRKLKLTMASFWHALEHDAAFAAELQQVWHALSYNVVAALYQAAIKGNSTAQQFWLKNRPPPHWSLLPNGTILTDDLETLEHEELLERARQEAPDFAAEIAARAATARSRRAPQTLPGADSHRDEPSRAVSTGDPAVAGG